MRHFLSFVLLLSLSFGVERSDLIVRDILPDEFSSFGSSPIYYPPPSNYAPVRGNALVGTVDTVGGTMYDWQFNGPSYRMIVNDPEHGVHVLWMFSPDALGGFPNRNMRYNFYEFTTRSWLFRDPPFMRYGTNAFPLRTGFGGFHILPTGEAIASAHGRPRVRLAPIVAKDVSPGAGLFPDTCSGAEPYLWPPISVTQNSWIHCLMIDTISRDNLHYTKIRDWCNWTDPILIGPVSGQPLANTGPCHNIASSLNSNKLMIMWTQWRQPRSPQTVDSAAYRISTDGGETWGPVTLLPFPPAFTPGSETTPSFNISSLYGFFDRNDVPHIVASLHPVVRDTGWVIPAEIWHWCPANTPNWSRVRRADPDTMAAPIGFNAIFATRPTIGQNPHNGILVVVWEEFIGTNREPTTHLLRGAIWGAASTDNGRTWLPPVLLTDTLTTTSFRFPCVAEVIDDTVWITYMGDRVAGFRIQDPPQGAATENPIFVHKVPCSVFVGIAEGKREMNFPTLSVYPNPFSKSTRLTITLPDKGGSLIIYDAAGRPVKRFLSLANRGTILWNGTDENGKELPRGIYFLRLSLKDTSVTEKVLKSH